VAEGVGFEPTEPFGSPVFKTGAIDHSTTPPLGKLSESRGDMHSLGNEIKEISEAGRSRREEAVGKKRVLPVGGQAFALCEFQEFLAHGPLVTALTGGVAFAGAFECHAAGVVTDQADGLHFLWG
jgi:hypothetical protein